MQAEIEADVPKESINQKIIDLKNFYNEITYCLTAYHLGYFKKIIRELESKLKEKYNLNNKNKSFSFKSKFKFKTFKKKEKKEEKAEEKQMDKIKIETGIDTLADQVGKSIVLDNTHVKDHYKLENITDCTVTINSSCKTLYLENVKNSKIVCGIVENSIFGNKIQGSQISCVAQQIRIHHTHQTRFNIFVTSNMIIEDSSGLEVGEFEPEEGECKAIFADSRFKGKVNNWRDVKDFNWIKNTPSPNFTVKEDK